MRRGAVQVQCKLMLDRWQAGHLKLSLDYLNVELGGFEFFRPSCSPLCIFQPSGQCIDKISGQRMRQKGEISLRIHILLLLTMAVGSSCREEG